MPVRHQQGVLECLLNLPCPMLAQEYLSQINVNGSTAIKAALASPAAVSTYKNFRFGYDVTPRSSAAEKNIQASARAYASKKSELKKTATRAYASGLVSNLVKVQQLLTSWLYPNAVALLKWFMANTCTSYSADFYSMTEHSCCLSSTYKDLNAVMEAAEALVAPGTGSYIRTIAEVPHAAPGPSDWYFAIHGYRTWARARVTRSGDAFAATVEYNMRDLYDWEEGSWAPGGLVFDWQMSQLHYWGLACEYEVTGAVLFDLNWTKGQRLEV